MGRDLRFQWSKDMVAVVTGANKGIGYEIVRLFAEEGLTVVLTSRDPGRGQAAVDALTEQGLRSVLFHPLDVTSAKSIGELVTWLQKEFGRLDILVNNAGVSPFPRVCYEVAKEVLDTNYYSLKRVTEGLLPLLRASPGPAGARIVNVSSRTGLYERLPEGSLKQTFRNEEKYSIELLDSLAAKYLEDVEAERQYGEGWIEAGKGDGYAESKILVNCYTRALARNFSDQEFVMAVCPGFTDTDLLANVFGGNIVLPKGYYLKSPADGADTAVWVALLPKQELLQKNGKFFCERTEVPLSFRLDF